MVQPRSPARPFLKWAGGKTQLLDEFTCRLPSGLGRKGGITRYVEPFIGGGALFFHLQEMFPFGRSLIADANREVILTYRVIRRSVRRLCEELAALESAYLSGDGTGQERFYYRVRDSFNDSRGEIDYGAYDPAWVQRAAMVIFLNRTCYNGLFRMNRKGEFNVPFGRYRRPEILDRENLQAVAGVLKKTEILLGDFECCRGHVDERTFVYLDPPYRPLTRTSSFTAYSEGGFPESDQRRLAALFRSLDRRGAMIMLSNSDPHDRDPSDTFFDDLYAGYTIERVPARRVINCNGTRRGNVTELIITNYRTGSDARAARNRP